MTFAPALGQGEYTLYPAACSIGATSAVIRVRLAMVPRKKEDGLLVQSSVVQFGSFHSSQPLNRALCEAGNVAKWATMLFAKAMIEAFVPVPSALRSLGM